MSRIDLTGAHPGKLTVVQFSHTDARAHSYWLCRCACGNERIVRRDALRLFQVRGCLQCDPPFVRRVRPYGPRGNKQPVCEAVS